MNILLIVPQFFGYDREIASELRRRGAYVDLLSDRPFRSAVLKGVTRLATNAVANALVPYYRRRLRQFGKSRYDIVLIINGQTIAKRLIAELRGEFSASTFILYMWDSLANRATLARTFRYFDDCWTFDRRCAREYGLKFRPLFYVPGAQAIATDNNEFDVSFIGTVHSDRYNIVNAVMRQMPARYRKYVYLYIQAKWVYYWKKLFGKEVSGAYVDEFHFVPLSSSEANRVFRGSRIILDVEHPRQVGLTIRTAEVIGARKRLITTNGDIREYDFYNDQNICIVDRCNPVVSKDFLDGEYVPIPADVYNRYSIAGWVDEVLGKRV